MKVQQSTISFNKAVNDLVDSLQDEVRKGSFVGLPDRVIDPFRVITAPEDAEPPERFFFTIILALPYSRAKMELVGMFTNVILTYKDGLETQRVIYRLTGEKLELREIVVAKIYIWRKISKLVVGILTRLSEDLQKRILAAQILAHLSFKDEQTSGIFEELQVLSSLRDVIYQDSNYLSRIMVAHQIKTTVQNDVQSLETWPTKAASLGLSQLPMGTTADEDWMTQTVDFLRMTDSSRPSSAFNCEDQVFTVAKLRINGPFGQHTYYNATIVVSNEFYILIPYETAPYLQAVKLMSTESTPQTHPLQNIQANDREVTISVTKEHYIQFMCHYTRLNVTKLLVFFDKEETANAFAAAVGNLSAQKHRYEAMRQLIKNTESSVSHSRRSVIFMDMTLSSDDDELSELAHTGKAGYLISPLEFRKSVSLGSNAIESVQDASQTQLASNLLESNLQQQQKSTIASHDVIPLHEDRSMQTRLYQKLRMSQTSQRDVAELKIQTPTTTSDSTSHCLPQHLSSPSYRLSQQHAAVIRESESPRTTIQTEPNLEGSNFAPCNQNFARHNAVEARQAVPQVIIEATENVAGNLDCITAAPGRISPEPEENQNICDRNLYTVSREVVDLTQSQELIKPVEHFIKRKATQNKGSSSVHEAPETSMNVRTAKDLQNVVKPCDLEKKNSYTTSNINSDQLMRRIMLPTMDDRVYANGNPAEIIKGEAITHSQNLRLQATKSNLGQSINQIRIGKLQRRVPAAESKNLKFENDRKPNHQNTTSIYSTRVRKGYSDRKLSGHSTLTVNCQHAMNPKGVDGDCIGDSNIDAPVEIEQSLRRPDLPTNQVSVKTLGSKSKSGISETTSINYFASQVAQMLLPEVATPRAARDSHKTTFGDRRQFIANVNTARNIPPQKQASLVEPVILKSDKVQKRSKPLAKSKIDEGKSKQYQVSLMRKFHALARAKATVQAPNKCTTRKSIKGRGSGKSYDPNRQFDPQKSRGCARPEVRTSGQNITPTAQYVSEENDVRTPLYDNLGTTLPKFNTVEMGPVNSTEDGSPQDDSKTYMREPDRHRAQKSTDVAAQNHADDTTLQATSDTHVQIASRTKAPTEIAWLLNFDVPKKLHNNDQQVNESNDETTITTDTFENNPYELKTACFGTPNPQRSPLIHFGPAGPKNQGILLFQSPLGQRSPTINGEDGTVQIVRNSFNSSSSKDHSRKLVDVQQAGNGYHRLIDGAEIMNIGYAPATTSKTSMVGSTGYLIGASGQDLPQIAPAIPIFDARSLTTSNDPHGKHLLEGSERTRQSIEFNTFECPETQLEQAPEPYKERVSSTAMQSSRSESSPTTAATALALQAHQQSKYLQDFPEHNGKKADVQSVRPDCQEAGLNNSQNRLITKYANVGPSASREMTRAPLDSSYVSQFAPSSLYSLPHVVEGEQLDLKSTLKAVYHCPSNSAALADRNRVSPKRKLISAEEPACSIKKRSRQHFNIQTPALNLPRQHNELATNPSLVHLEPNVCKSVPKRLRHNKFLSSTKYAFSENLVASTPDNFTKLLDRSTSKYRFGDDSAPLNRMKTHVLVDTGKLMKANKHSMDAKSTQCEQMASHKFTHTERDLFTSSGPGLRDTSAPANLHSSMLYTKVSPMRDNLQNSINETLTTVLFHITANEDRLKANVSAIHSGGQILLEKFRETFANQAHHRSQKLKSCVQEEVGVLNNSLQLLRQPGRSAPSPANQLTSLENIYTNRCHLISQLDNNFDK